jgi:hypothetical protein
MKGGEEEAVSGCVRWEVMGHRMRAQRPVKEGIWRG